MDKIFLTVLIGVLMGIISAIVIMYLAADADIDDWPDEDRDDIPKE